MCLFGRKKEKVVDISDVPIVVKEVFVAKAEVVSSYNDGQGCGPRCVNMFFLVKVVDGKYHELFSNSKLDMESDCHHDGCCTRNFDTPYIEKIYRLTRFIKKGPNDKLTIRELFQIINHLNVLNDVGALDDIDELEKENEE